MKIKVNVSNIKKPVFNRIEVQNFISDIAEKMQDLTIENAPEDTRTLKNYGIEKKVIDAGIYGEEVYLDKEAVKNNHPYEHQRKRPDGGNYPYYQEEGWTQYGIYHPGKHYFKKSFEMTKWEAETELKSVAKKVITLK